MQGSLIHTIFNIIGRNSINKERVNLAVLLKPFEIVGATNFNFEDSIFSKDGSMQEIELAETFSKLDIVQDGQRQHTLERVITAIYHHQPVYFAHFSHQQKLLKQRKAS